MQDFDEFGKEIDLRNNLNFGKRKHERGNNENQDELLSDTIIHFKFVIYRTYIIKWIILLSKAESNTRGTSRYYTTAMK